MGVIIFNDISCEDYGIVVEHYPEYQTPDHDYDVIHVPGRNGDIAIDQGSFQNVDRVYQIAVGSYERKYTEQVNAIAEWLHSPVGYAKLEDSYEPEYYRMAICTDGFEAENMSHKLARTTITFNCKPQRWLKVGSIAVENPMLMKNPTKFPASPIIMVYGSGILTFQNDLNDEIYTLTITDNSTGIVINCEVQDVYSALDMSVNCNNKVSLNGKGFPKLLSGDTSISATGDISKVEVIPKWWTV